MTRARSKTGSMWRASKIASTAPFARNRSPRTMPPSRQRSSGNRCPVREIDVRNLEERNVVVARSDVVCSRPEQAYTERGA